ncbi:MAG: glycerol-3-phosphate acyltransferase [Candidatus Diapherotrites archaeon]|nr:glycerol-3-phosphate acyltransferase [Candidatus Diapherotrites archaeon]
MDAWLAYLLAYLYGSIPFSYIVARFWGHDVSEEGSKNVGASNVAFVTGSATAAIVAVVLDASKGIIPSLIWGPIAGAFGVVGHVFSFWLIISKFRFRRIRSGLGMAATVGWLLVNAWQMAIIALITFAVFYIIMNPLDWRREGIGKWYDIQEGNIETVFTLGAGAVIYILAFHPPGDVQTAIAIILTAVFYAYARVIREQIQYFWDWKKSEEYLKRAQGEK